MFLPLFTRYLRSQIGRVALLSLGSFALAATSQATVLAYDTFDSYTSGSSLSGLDGGYGWESSWSTNVTTDVSSSSSISFNNGSIVRGGGNSLVISSQSSSSAITRSMASDSSTYTGSTYYTSFIFQVNYGTGTSTTVTNVGYQEGSSFFGVGVDNGTTSSVTSLPQGGMNGARAFARVNASGVTDNVDQNQIKYNNTYFMVVEHVWSGTTNSYSSVNVYLYDEANTISGQVVSYDGTASETSIEQLAMRVFYIGGGDRNGEAYTNDVDLIFDDFLFADSFESATGAIPEPSTYAALAGLAVLGIAVLRRKRRG
ncbi:PEP-CTERM sorting domain-containing protein [Ruficoccus sp. ZRK36]|uniref:PEP-CTERM sorting domain-containing protein n=1 Tax=Ruficoccus sp. ZRK36 TaxID=2866311 RepID=UPI001C73A69B|nr:PEP-CTERM sorting domain-containing protein [Ruficoccus sp. ZRK36]QYY36773.1 PEP-CTERM sorting domain-containing protein [Ruficoccus sp. ZRK36]